MNARATQLLSVGLLLEAVGALTTEGLALLGLGLCALGLMLGGHLGKYRQGLACLAIFLGFLLISSLWATPPRSIGAPWSALHWAFLPVTVVALRHAPASLGRSLVRVVTVVGLLSAALSVFQHFHHVDWPGWLEKVLPVHRMDEAAPERFGGYMGGGLHFHRLKFGHTLVPLGLACVTWVTLRGQWRWSMLGLVALALLGLAATFARASFVGLGAAALGAGLAFVLPRFRGWLAGLAVLGGALAPLLMLAVGHGPEDRMIAWHLATTLITQHPLLGVGYGGYRTAAFALLGNVPNEKWTLIHLDAHSTALEFPAEGGLVAVVLLVWALKRFGTLLGPLSVGQVAIISAASAIGITHNLGWHPVVPAAFGLALALAEPVSASSSGSAPVADA